MTELTEKIFILRKAENCAALYAHLKNNWEALAKTKTPLVVSVKPDRGKRSREQNKRYWLIIQTIAENAWCNGKRYSADVWHEYYKRKFIGLVDLPGGGSYGASTTNLNTQEFGAYMDKVSADCQTEFGIELFA